ncbi:MAG: hypothetical protein SFX73_10720 [Kofleriaceae bacterium]|nr:hypothetical protein [Kofleriaceae bacterium]
MFGTRSSLALITLVVASCGDDTSQSTEILCGTGTSGALAAGASVSVGEAGKDLKGAAITAQAKTTVPAGEVTIECAGDIVPEGFIALGPAVTFGAEGTWSDRPFELTLPYKHARLPTGAEPRHVRIIAKRAGQTDPFFPPVSNRLLDHKDAYASLATFRAGELTTYQVVAAADAGTPVTQNFAWRAVVGISMGGFASNSLAMRYPDKFDIIADIGGDPGPSMVYVLGMIRDYLFGGFCTAEDEAAGRGNIGQLCPKESTRKEQFELTGDYEHQFTQTGDGVGLTLRRSLYVRAARDLARALSNPAHYNKDNPYLPPGVDMDFINQSAAERCANPKVLEDFFDREFNPTGAKPVITFCDGSDLAGMNAVFDPNGANNDPAEVLLAVDLNGNGKRDAGEPVVTNAYEPFSDVGVDGKASKDEPGYDAVTNPDPAKDDYHYLRNPLGTEGNGEHETQEPFEDIGLDGVPATCQQGETPADGVGGCYDFGQGNGTWDLSPNVARWYGSDTLHNMQKLTKEQREHMAFWFDAGIRDFLNNSLAANVTVGGLMAKHNAPFGVYDSFPVLTGASSETGYDFTEIDWTEMPRDLYVRYGNPDATQAEIEKGDGRHVGTAVQIINRATTAFAWIDKRFPDGDRSETYDGGKIIKDLVHTSPRTGRASPYGVFLPPGYDAPENANVRYPVVYFFHGYGQQPQDLVDLSSVFALYMIAERELAVRFQKFIIVYVDGRCRPQMDGVPVDPTGDKCEGGTFYMDAPLGGPARMEMNLMDLIDHIDATYRTKKPSPATFVP